MKKIILKGAASAVPTPFTKNSIDALVICGTTGESSTMTKEEQFQSIKCAIETSNR